MPRYVELDMRDVRVLLIAATRVLDDIDEREVKADFKNGSTRSQNPDAAAAQRDLLRLRDLLTTAAGEVAMAWWALKGTADPRFPDTEDAPVLEKERDHNGNLVERDEHGNKLTYTRQ